MPLYSIKHLSSSDPLLRDYDLFVLTHPQGNLWQSSIWGEFREKAFPREIKTLRLAVLEETRIVATCQLLLQRLPFQKSWLYAPRGPLLDWNNQEIKQLLFQEIQKIARLSNTIYLLFDPLLEKNEEHLFQLPVISCQLPVATHAQQYPQTLLLDLTKTPEQLLSEMKPKGRYNIKLAEKKDVQIRRGTSKDLSVFYNLVRQTTQRDGFQSHQQNYYQTMLEVFRKKNLIELFLAEYRGEVIAGGIFLFFGKQAVYYYGASADQHRNLMAPYLLQWHAILEARQRGCKIYDFLGISSDRLAGVTDFKLKFGGKETRWVGTYQITYKPVWNWLIRTAKLIKRIIRK